MSMTCPFPCGRLVGTGGVGVRNFSSSWDGLRGFQVSDCLSAVRVSGFRG